jgi:hypothetical protein
MSRCVLGCTLVLLLVASLIRPAHSFRECSGSCVKLNDRTHHESVLAYAVQSSCLVLVATARYPSSSFLSALLFLRAFTLVRAAPLDLPLCLSRFPPHTGSLTGCVYWCTLIDSPPPPKVLKVTVSKEPRRSSTSGPAKVHPQPTGAPRHHDPQPRHSLDPQHHASHGQHHSSAPYQPSAPPAPLYPQSQQQHYTAQYHHATAPKQGYY